MFVTVSAGMVFSLLIAVGSVLMIEPLLGGANTYQMQVRVDDPHAPPAATHIWTQWRIVLEHHQYTEETVFGGAVLRRYIRAGWPLRVLHGGDDSGDCVCGVELDPGRSHLSSCFPIGIYPLRLLVDSLLWGGLLWMLLYFARVAREPMQTLPASGSELVHEIDSPHGMGNRLVRTLWSLTWILLFRPSPRPLHRWRNWLLRLFGARMHPTARVYPRGRIWLPSNLIMDRHACIADDVDVYCVAPVTIGAYTTVSQYGFLCTATHDFEDVRHPLVAKPITIGTRCWLAADVFVAPGVTIADGAVVGARSSVFSDLPEWTVCAGTPAKPVRTRAIGPADFGEEVHAEQQRSRGAEDERGSSRP